MANTRPLEALQRSHGRAVDLPQSSGRPATVQRRPATPAGMRRTTQLLLVSFILDSALAGVCNQTTGAACTLVFGLPSCGWNQECLGYIPFVSTGNCYCKDTCFVNGACSTIENAFCTFDTTTDCSSISNSQCRYSCVRYVSRSDRRCAGHSAICSNRQVRWMCCLSNH